MMTLLTSRSHNHLLKGLSEGDFANLSASFELIEAQARDCLYRPDVASEAVFFPVTGVASVTSQSDPMRLELGLVGREGFLGVPVLLGDGISPTAAVVQVPGTFLKIPAPAFRAAIAASREMRSLFLRYAHTWLVQVGSTAVANGTYNVEERLARWLLMVSDRTDETDLALTHEVIAMMLGVRRPGVTVATHVLEGQHAIRATRGRVHIIDRSKLIRLAGASYGSAEAEYERLLGQPQAGDAMDNARMDGSGRPASAQGLAGYRVLVVEDDYDLAHDAEHALQAAGGTVVGPVAREEQALALLAQRPPGCALVDINLGGGARFVLADALERRGIPFAFVTGYDDNAIPARFNRVERVRKPAEPYQIVEAASRLCTPEHRPARTAA